jgi:hypothetical protein
VFHTLEARFARQARATTAIAGVSGFYMAWRLDAWDRLQSASLWWMHAMVFTWLVFTTMLFVVEPLFLERCSRVVPRWLLKQPIALLSGCTASCLL